LAHEGLGALIAYRLTRRQRLTVAAFATDYGLEILARSPPVSNPEDIRSLLSTEALEDDLTACLNATEMAKRQFREIARIAGLTFQGYPGQRKSARQLQASSGLFYEVFDRYEPDHLLLKQARREVLDRQLDLARLRESLEQVGRMRIVLRDTDRLTPFAFPIWSERVHSSVSSESWSERVQRMIADLEKAADGH
jgi:ATP-dependent Lhr-like helicase